MRAWLNLRQTFNERSIKAKANLLAIVQFDSLTVRDERPQRPKAIHYAEAHRFHSRRLSLRHRDHQTVMTSNKHDRRKVMTRVRRNG
jgi:hypothetical protein